MISIIKKCKFIFYTSIPHAGTTFLFSVLEKNPNISTIMLNDELFSYISKDKSKQGRIRGIKEYYRIINNICSQINIKYDSQKVLRILYDISKYISKEDNYYEYISRLIGQKSSIGIREIIICLFQAKMLSEKKTISDNMTPVFIFDPHSRVDAALKHKEIIELFQDYIFYSSYRNPIYMTASSIKSNYYVNLDITKRLIMLNIMGFIQNFPKKWKSKYYISRFEDEKLYPEQTFKAICSFLGVSYSDDMLLANEEGPTCRGYVIKGFDTEPVTRKLNDIFSDEDIIFLEKIYSKIMSKYHYINYVEKYSIVDENKMFIKAEKFLKSINRKEFIFSLKEIEKSISNMGEWFFPKLIEKETI